MNDNHEMLSLPNAFSARHILRKFLSPTPLRQYKSIDRIVGAQLFVKHENHNPTGTFKIRGGINLMHYLKAMGVKGVTTYSTGNHGTSVATSARMFGLAAVVVVPKKSNPLKVQSIKDAGAELIEYGIDFEESSEKVAQLVSVHPEMVDCGSDQGRSVLATAGVAALRRGLPKRENTGLGRKMPFMDGH